jgi:hypothetical protein
MVPTGNITPAGPLQMAKTLGSPLASMGLGGLEESDFITETQKMTEISMTLMLD